MTRPDVWTDSSPTLGATGELAKTTIGMGIAEMKQCSGADFVRIARLISMHGSISPKKVEIARYHRDLLQLKQSRRERMAEQKLSCRVIQNDLVEEIEEIQRSDRSPVRCHDKVAGAPL